MIAMLGQTTVGLAAATDDIGALARRGDATDVQPCGYTLLEINKLSALS